MRSILQNYYKHLKTNPESMIMKVFGLHKILFTKSDSKKVDTVIYFIIMKNAFGGKYSIDY